MKATELQKLLGRKENQSKDKLILSETCTEHVAEAVHVSYSNMRGTSLSIAGFYH